MQISASVAQVDVIVGSKVVGVGIGPQLLNRRTDIQDCLRWLTGAAFLLSNAPPLADEVHSGDKTPSIMRLAIRC